MTQSKLIFSLAFFALIASSHVARSAEAPESAVTKAMRTQMVKIGGPNGAFCYANEDAAIQGYNVDKPVRIASVMKLLTTFWAVETRGVNSRFETIVSIQRANKEMHISGVRDPYFDRQRLGLLLADLNRMGITELNKLTIDSNFWIDYGALDFLQYHAYALTTKHAGTSLAAQDLKQKLEDGFNTANWSKSSQGLYEQRAKEGGLPKLPAKVEMKIASVDVVPSNPLIGKPGVETFVLRSAPLSTYLREMNILSANPMADELFASMGGVAGFQKFMAERFGTTFNFDNINSGSGLPVYPGKVRKDTIVSCRTVVSLIRRMDHDLEKQGHDLADVMRILGKDKEGQFGDGSNAIIAKTGTVDGAKNLAGVENTTDGEVYFGIFLQGAPTLNGHATPNLRASISKMMMNLPHPKAVSTPAFRFDPLDSSMQLAPAVFPKLEAPPLLRKP